MEDYYKFFHSTVLGGIACGLNHPVEWIINAHRTPGGTLTPAYYWKVEKHVPRFLVEIFKSLFLRLPDSASEVLEMCDLFLRLPDSASEVLEMCDNHYPKGHLCRGYFNFLKVDIEEYLKERKP